MTRKGLVIDIDTKYQKFLLIKYSGIKYSQERFKALSNYPQRKIIDKSSIKE